MITDYDKERGYRECAECRSGIELLQAGFDVETRVCAVCKKEVADLDEFFQHKQKTELGKKLVGLRESYINSGGTTLSADEIEREKAGIEVLGK